jgi:cyclopropane fatty-acyl-phospholipid synthase-like methyltransferase
MQKKDHWEQVYEKQAVHKLGWFEESPDPSLELIETCKLGKDATMLHVGAGATTLVDVLLRKGYEKIVANDISTSSLEILKARLGPEQAGKVHWIVDDVTKPDQLNSLGPVDLWHDRAVLHFFSDPSEQLGYFNLLRKLVKLDGYVIIAAFNLSGAEKCSGLPVFRYNQAMLLEKLGEGFSLLKAFDFTYLMPSGDTREYIYTLFQRRSLASG